ncbi:MAG: AAA family ATPase, partial [Psychromonas sp.]|nr:AAA family ATPase [Psychromonas sp.]
YCGALLFSSNVCRKISQASRGIPRLINVLAHKVLILSYGQQHYKITTKLVKEAVVDTEDAYALQSLSGWWLLLLSFLALNVTLLLWWKGLL